MFSLLDGFVRYLLKKDEIRILVLGIDGAGKTTLVEKIKVLYSGARGLSPEKIRPTVGLNVGRIDLAGSKVIFWDLGGQAGLRTIWDHYYTETHGVIFVVDATNQKRFEEAKGAMERVLGSRELSGAPLLLVANKKDVDVALGEKGISEHFGVGKVGKSTCRVAAASAFNGDGVQAALDWLLDAIRKSGRASAIKNRMA